MTTTKRIALRVSAAVIAGASALLIGDTIGTALRSTDQTSTETTTTPAEAQPDTIGKLPTLGKLDTLCRSTDAYDLTVVELHRLTVAGWYGDPADGMELLYSPACATY